MRVFLLMLVATLAACVVVWLTPKEAESIPGCIVQVHGDVGVVICAGEPVGTFPVPTVTVTTHVNVPVPGPTATVTAPVATVTIGAPGDTQTVIVPGPAHTETVTVGPSALPTPSAAPTTPASTETVTVSPTGQPTPADGTIEPSAGPTPSGPLDINFGDGKISVVEAGIGILTLLALIGLLLVAMYAGYILGYKDKERKDTDFMRALLETAKMRRVKK